MIFHFLAELWHSLTRDTSVFRSDQIEGNEVMATGPEHYQRAEQLIELADTVTDPTQIEGGWETTTDAEELDTRRYLMDSAHRDAAGYLAAAQVHATLAMAAATALGLGRADDNGMLPEDANAWIGVAGTQAAIA